MENPRLICFSDIFAISRATLLLATHRKK